MKALVTGASSGMGKDMAKYLLDLGYDLFVAARNEKLLNEVYADYSNVTIISLDLSCVDNCVKLYEMLKDKDIDVLINNVGFGAVGNFSDISLDRELEMIDLNIKSYHVLTKLFLNDFISKNSGRILNVASIAGFMPGPYMATYYATKSYVVNLSLSIYEELIKSKSNVKISIFCPGPVKTNFDRVANVINDRGGLDSRYAAKYAIDGMFKDNLLIIPLNMKLNRFFVRLCPVKLLLYINSKIQERKFRL